MVKFVAYKAADNADLPEIGLFRNIKKNLDRKGEGQSFDASSGNIDMHVTGTAMLFVLKKPTAGVMKTIDVKVGGVEQYTLQDLDLNLRKLKDTFSGDYEKTLFKGADKLVGSSEGDRLSGFNGKDKIKAGEGDDSVKGGKGGDTIYGEGGDDVLAGNSGRDWLDGGSGINSLTGGKGKDTFHFSSQLSADNLSTITDFKSGADRIELMKAVFPGLSGNGELGADQFVKAGDYAGEAHVVVYDQTSGGLSYAVTSGTLVKFGAVSAGLDLASSDLFIV